MGVDIDTIKKDLFKIAMKGKWDEVVKIYKKNPMVHDAQITRSGDTALHIAVSDGQEDAVAEMVKLVQSERVPALRIQNERGNTALHFAASMGSVAMCQQIASTDPSLVDIRNFDGETPIFLAALHGRKEAFLCLHYICFPSPDQPVNYSNCTRNDGDTILHCAIAGDYFDLAFQIIHLYGDLVNRVNEKGSTPLHLLATKPSAFRSGSRLQRFENIIYHCIYVGELKEESYDAEKFRAVGKGKGVHRYPQNYKTCMAILGVFQNGVHIVANKLTRKETQMPLSNGAGAKESHPFFPPNYDSCFHFLKFVYLAMLVILGQGSSGLKKIQRKKEKHIWSAQIMNKLLESASDYEYDDTGSKPLPSSSPTDTDGEHVTAPYDVIPRGDRVGSINKEQQDKAQQPNSGDNKSIPDKWKKETPILIAAKNGVTEMVEKILELFPVAIHDMDAEKKNIVLLAVENRQPHVYELLHKRNILKESLFRKVDYEGNSALHLAAKLGDYKPWLIPGAALQMQWEIKWYEFVKDSMPAQFFVRYNNNNKTPKDIFTETHTELVKNGGEWLSKTSESCSVVAALIATVAFATSTTVPGGVQESTGTPTLESKPAFNVFAISSLVALCCSVTSVVMFLSILTSRYQEYDFGSDLPNKLILGLTSLFVSIASMLVSFCAGHFFVLKDELKYAAYPIYAVTSLPVTLFAMAQFPLYFDLVWATFKKVPQRSYKATPL
ncbi:hypothetical protein L6164_034516 [Bauhinia variegata]|uniref:Uncharacterized protein n=1 Tax=Bauhinia variegata TaxID=167791 RepID=A0ACB9KVP2_BAUVA|nr:hypothetical protein L6164_034516 [Bauhinia variegata]